MPRSQRPPSYRHHQARGCAVVTVDGRNHYLGTFGSPESHERYARLTAEWRLHSDHLLTTRGRRRGTPAMSVDELILACFGHAQSYYANDGRPTSEQDNIRQALRPVRRLHGASPAHEFGPVALANARGAMVAAGRSRKLSNEVAQIRPCEVDTSGEVWLHQPRHHKTENFDRLKVIMLGPRAQGVPRPWLDREADAYCIAPAEAAAWHRRRCRSGAPSSRPSEAVSPSAPKTGPGPMYTRHSDRVAIQRACRRAGIPPWSPRQLRYTRATAIRKALGLEAAKVVLGHTDTKMT